MDNWIYMDLNERESKPMNTYITGLSERASKLIYTCIFWAE